MYQGMRQGSENGKLPATTTDKVNMCELRKAAVSYSRSFFITARPVILISDYSHTPEGIC